MSAGVLLAGMMVLAAWVLFGPWTVITAFKVGFNQAGLLLGGFGLAVTALGLWLLKHLHFKKR